MSRPRRVVLDTNLVLSALVFSHGRLARPRQTWHDRRIRPVVSRVTVAELVRALAYPKLELSPEEQRELLGDYLPFCATVRMPTNPPAAPPCRDRFDVPFLELALVGRAEYLVTGDRDLLSLARRLPCPIVTAEQLLAALASEEQG